VLWPSAIRSLRQTSGEVDFGLDQPLIPVTIWDRGGDNQFTINGRLTLDGDPVGGARVGLDAYTLPTPTTDDGTFTLRGDRTVLSRLRLHVADASGATAGGMAADGDALSATETVIETAFPIVLDSNTPVAAGATVTGKVTFADGAAPAPQVVLWGYQLTGTVTDASGTPVSGAHVSVSDDEGETWAVSGQTVDDGVYSLRFYPLEDGEISVRISLGSDLLSSAAPIGFAANTSAHLDLVAMTSDGMVMGTGPDGAFAVEPIPGAEYVGYLVGIAVDDVPVTGVTTWPNANGAFSVTLPDPLPAGDLSFFQARLRFLTAERVVSGEPVADGIIPDTLDAFAPRNLPPALTLN